ncbi:DUF5714 domain-containing protein [Methanolobus sp. ZRKC3]|uniref:DUF5714 domain-containing protein n=1 Tax=Methanolobus sp. ZRKC3 TaxID=3125786 RepID=UPI0032506590
MDIIDQKVNCMICGDEVEYMKESVDSKCHYCGIEEKSYFKCVGGHYVCENCHTHDALDVIKNICLNTELKNPMTLAEKMLEHPKIHMFGPEHHSLLPAALVAAYQNYLGQKNEKQILEAIERGKKVPGGFCFLCGACGGGLGVGIAVSVLSDATAFTPHPRSHANWATSKGLKRVADAGGVRCCKKATRIGVEEGVAYISEMFGVDWAKELDLSVKCKYSDLNKQCDVACKYRP